MPFPGRRFAFLPPIATIGRCGAVIQPVEGCGAGFQPVGLRLDDSRYRITGFRPVPQQNESKTCGLSKPVSRATLCQKRTIFGGVSAPMLLRAKALQKSYMIGREPLHVLKGCSLEADRGEFLVVMGASGSGKSTLLHLLGALDRPDRGTIEFEDRNLFELGDRARRAYRNRQVGFVFQFYHLLPECNVLENVLMPAMVGTSCWTWRQTRSQARRQAEGILDRVGLSERKNHRPAELSGGERQRVAIARALIYRPALLLADEPTGNLDASIGREILKLLTELNEAGQTIVMVTHDANVASHAHRILHLREGVIHEPQTRGEMSSTARFVPKEVAP